MVSFGTINLSPDRTIGMFQIPPTDFPGGDFASFYSHVFAARQEELRRTGNFRMTEKQLPFSAIEHCTIRTEYRPLYRIHSKKYFETGVDYVGNWVPSERKRQRAERYSPYGTEGFYFGWTLNGAEDEARFGSGGIIDPKEYMILVIEACLDNILYLTAGCLDAVWSVVGLDPPDSIMDMYEAIMDPRTDNETTNAIGRWAREQGFNGIIYPSARYGQEDWAKKRMKEGYSAIPAINFVEMGSHLCQNFVAFQHARHAADIAIQAAGGLEKCIPLWAESNLVLFDGKQVNGEERGVIYQTFPLNLRDAAMGQDVFGRQSRSFTYWASEIQPPWISGD